MLRSRAKIKLGISLDRATAGGICAKGYLYFSPASLLRKGGSRSAPLLRRREAERRALRVFDKYRYSICTRRFLY